MKKNKQPIEVKPSKGLLKKIGALFADGTVDLVIESGTYLGRGTTQMFIDAWDIAFPDKKGLVPINTIEAKGWAYEEAKSNLSGYTNINVIYGMSLGFEESKRFIQKDIFLEYHDRFPDVLIDNVENPKGYYLTELHTMRGAEEHTLTRLITQFKDDRKILFCLDSCGGLGLFEFNAVEQQMDKKGFYMFLDDINHCKHYRSFEKIKANQDGRWEILYSTTRVALVRRLAG